MASTVTKGSDLMLFIAGKSIAFAKTHTLSISAETADTSTKDSGGIWASSEVTKLSWTASSENLFSADGSSQGKTYDDLNALMIARTPIEAHFSVKTEAEDVPTGGYSPKSANGYKGNVIITSLEANASNGENATFSVQFQGVGALSKVTE